MPRIPRDIVDAVRDRTDLAEVIGRHVALSRRGKNFVGLCPFHQEKTPSFNVIPDKGIFHCFGCETGGDVFKFLMLLEGLSFVEVVKELAGPAGVTIEEREMTAAERRAMKQRATLFDVLTAASRFYEAELWTRASGATARAYLERRQIEEGTSRAAGLGWAPGGWTRLIDHLHKEGFSPEQIADSGLARPRQSGSGFYDTLRERLVIPIRDERGRTIAFGGRLLEGDGPKYLNTPETRLYQKSRVLFGLDVARAAIAKKGRALVVEGYFDVISLRQAGFEETVATCGTALTPDHLEKIRRLSRDVLLLLDADEAGQNAAERTLEAFVSASIQPWRVTVPGAKDPDELVRESGAEALEEALNRKQPLFEWVVSRRLDRYGTSSMSRERVLEEVLPLLARAKDDVLTFRVSARLGMSEAAVRKQLTEFERRPREPRASEASAGETAENRGWKPHVDMVHLLWLLVHHRDHVADLLVRADPSLFDGHAEVRPALARLVSGEPVATIIDETGDRGVKRTLLAVVARDSLYTAEQAPRAVIEILMRLTQPLRAARLAKLQEDVTRFEAAGQFDELQTTVREKMELQKREKALERALRESDLDGAMSLLGTP
ncbi:MAG: DNA primase [Myxococcota bacterium]